MTEGARQYDFLGKDGSPTAAALTAACAERKRASTSRAIRVARPWRIERGKHVKRRIDPARISALTHYTPSRARPPKVPASLSHTFRLFSLNNIHFYPYGY